MKTQRSQKKKKKCPENFDFLKKNFGDAPALGVSEKQVLLTHGCSGAEHPPTLNEKLVGFPQIFSNALVVR